MNLPTATLLNLEIHLYGVESAISNCQHADQIGEATHPLSGD